jgi:hypothetical protein
MARGTFLRVSPSHSLEREMQTACWTILEWYVLRVEITPSALRLETNASDQASSLKHHTPCNQLRPSKTIRSLLHSKPYYASKLAIVHQFAL